MPSCDNEFPNRTGTIPHMTSFGCDSSPGSEGMFAGRKAMAIRCSKCGSDRVVPRASIWDQGGLTYLQAHVHKHPDALLLKGTTFATLYATNCGACGFTEIYAEGASGLYEAYCQGQGR
jgi:hypothetical protein